MIELSLSYGTQEIDIAVHEEQTVADVLQIMEENFVLPQQDWGSGEVVSERKKHALNMQESFARQNIYNGDVLLLYAGGERSGR